MHVCYFSKIVKCMPAWAGSLSYYRILFANTMRTPCYYPGLRVWETLLLFHLFASLYAIIYPAMDVFISWSGERSRAAAEALRDWLPMIINAAKPFLSVSDIEKGTRWSSELALRLQSAKAGIICVTPANIHSDWLLFETGALSKTIADTFVCPLLIGLEPSNLKGPLAQFQATKTSKSDVLRLMKTLNAALGDQGLSELHIEKAFAGWWPQLESQLKSLPTDGAAPQPNRTERDLLEEILGLVRIQDRNPTKRFANFPIKSKLIMETVWQTLVAQDPRVQSIHPLAHPSSYLFLVEDANNMYEISIPGDTPINDIEDVVKSQVRVSQERLRPTDTE